MTHWARRHLVYLKKIEHVKSVKYCIFVKKENTIPYIERVQYFSYTHIYMTLIEFVITQSISESMCIFASVAVHYSHSNIFYIVVYDGFGFFFIFATTNEHHINHDWNCTTRPQARRKRQRNLFLNLMKLQWISEKQLRNLSIPMSAVFRHGDRSLIQSNEKNLQ